MKRNNFFSPTRFMLLLRNDLILNYKKYLLTIVGALIVGYIVLYMFLPQGDHFLRMDEYYKIRACETAYNNNAFPFFLIGLGLFLGLSFPALSSKTTGMSYLLMPSSNFEKFLSQVLIRIVIGTVLVLCVFWVDAYLARETILMKYGRDYGITAFKFSYIFRSNDQFFRNAVFSLILSIGVFLFSVRLYFNKISLVKTVLALAISIGLIFLLFFVVSELFYPIYDFSQPFIPEYWVKDKTTNFEYFVATMYTLPWIFFMPLAYFKLKEKQL